MRPVVEPHHETPQYETPQYQAPQHETPPHQTPQYEVPQQQYEASQQQYEAPQQHYEASHYQDPYEEEEKTAHLSPEEAQHLLNSSVHIPEAPSRILGGEEATQFAEFSPHQPAQPTPAQPHGLYEEDEATLLADVSSLLKEGFTPEPKRVTYREPAPRSASDRDQPRSLSQVDWDLD